MNKDELIKLKGTIFKHFKGDVYLVMDIAEHTETEEDMVIYKALYNDCKIYVRPLTMFLEEVPKGKENPTNQKYRFEPMYFCKLAK